MRSLSFTIIAFVLCMFNANAELQECMDGFTSLLDENAASVPFFYSATGDINLAYLYQKPVFSFFPAATLGAYDMCINAGIFTPAGSDMTGKYCSVGGHNAGICVPSACTAEDLNEQALAMHIIQLNTEVTQSVPYDCWLDAYLTEGCAKVNTLKKYLEAVYPFLVNIPSLENIDCDNNGLERDAMTDAMFYFISIAATLAVIGAGWDYMRNDSVLVYYYNSIFYGTRSSSTTPTKPKVEETAVTAQNTPTKGNLDESARAADALALSRSMAEEDINRVPEVPTFLDCFNLSKNWNEVLTLDGRGGEFSAFDGMRALSCWWVIVCHVILWQVGYMDNPMTLLPPNGILGQWWSAPFFNFTGTYCVETFFFISSFLATYLLLFKLDKESKKNVESKSLMSWMPSMFIHRVLRVLPSYAFTLFVHWKVAPFLAYGPNADYLWGFDVKACEKQWWKHLLFVNNITPWWNQRFGNICFGHTWYLANDMQFFLLVPVFVVLYRYSSIGKKLAISGLLALTAACIAITWHLSIDMHWSPSTWDAEENINYTEEGFSRPWVRITPYTIGMLFGFMWYEKKCNAPDFKFTTFQRFFILLSGLGILAGCMFGPYKSDLKPCIITMGQDSTDCGSQMNQFAKSALLSLGRPAWTCGLGLLSILCWNGQGGYINSFLSAPIWTPFSNLSFTTYLCHYTVLTYYIGQRVTRINFGWFEFVTMYFGLVIFSTMYALVTALLVEKPFMKLQKKYLKF